jgi:outer membrane lipoprotein carrier protein
MLARTLITAVTCASLAPLAATPQGDSRQAAAPADQLVRRIQGHFDRVRDFQAAFTQIGRDAVFERARSARGEVRIKKPGRMRWKYTSPDAERKEIVADGVQVFVYDPNDNSVSRTPMPKVDESSTALTFLLGRGDLARDFNATPAAVQPEGAWALTLVPRIVQADFAELTLVVNRRSLALEGLTALYPQGDSHEFRFTNLHENVGLSDREFEFKMPKGAVLK